MNRKYLTYLNFGFAAVAALIFARLLWLVAFWMWGVAPIDSSEEEPHTRRLARNPFTQEETAYDAIDDLLDLERQPPQLSLPDLRKALTFTGTNGRPDADPEQTRYHLKLKGDSQSNAVVAGEPAYLAYDSDAVPPRYVWSPDNAQTRLWIEVHGDGDSAKVSVRMRGLGDAVISEPSELATLTLKARRTAGSNKDRWKIGQWRVDGTLLARQRARWYGRDLFLEEHGGDEYAHLLGKERIDFGEGAERYSVWVAKGDCLAWDGSRWQQADLLSGSSRQSPLLCLEKLGDKVMTYQLWDVDGRRKVAINLVRSTELWKPTVLEKDFRFVGARTRTQSIVEIRGERMTLRPFDWLVLTEEGWKKLVTAQDIDNYVDRQLSGPLFIFEGIEKHDGVHWMLGTLYNASRTQKHEMMISSSEKRVESTIRRTTPREDTIRQKETKTTENASSPVPSRTPDEEVPNRSPGVRGVIPMPIGDPDLMPPPTEEMIPDEEEPIE